MQLNLRKEKGLTIENVRTIIQLGINYGEKLNALEATCIEEYKSLDHSYLPGDHCFYGGYLYECIATASGEWNPTRWKKVGDDLTPVTKADIEALIGLSAEEIQTLASIILDTEIRIDKTYSSSKIYTDIQQCLHDSKTFTLRQLSNTKMPHYSVVGSVDDVTEEGVLYLVKRSDSNICDIYAFISNAPQSLTTTEINLDNIYTKTEVDELLDKKADKATTMPSDKIITNVDDATTDNILSASTTLEAIDDKITESIVTTLDENVTDDQIPSAKVVFDKLDEVFQNVDNVKESLASTITDKGVYTSKDDTFETMIENVKQISSSVLNTYEEISEYSAVPKMTSDIKPLGVVSASSVYGSSYAYYAFDNDTTAWTTQNGKYTDQWIQYKFDKPICISKVEVDNSYGENAIKNFRIEASHDGIDYDILYTGLNTNTTAKGLWTAVFENDTKYLYYRVFVVDCYATTYVKVNNIRFIARIRASTIAKPLIPTMTSDTLPSGIASSSSVNTSYKPYLAFNNQIISDLDMWASADNASTYQWIQYQFENPTVAKMISIAPRVYKNNIIAPKAFTLEASNNGIDYIFLCEDTIPFRGALPKFVTFNNETAYTHYRITFDINYTGTFRAQISHIQLYN